MADYLRSVISSLPLEDQAEVAGLMAATTQAQREEAAYAAALPGRMADIEDLINEGCADLLPEGLRVEWGPADA